MTTIMEISGATDNINYTRPNDAGMDLKALEATTITAHARTRARSCTQAYTRQSPPTTSASYAPEAASH